MSRAAPDAATGLTSDEARRRLAAQGTNAVQDVVENPINRAFKKLWAPVPWMLEAAILLQLALGECVEASVIRLPEGQLPPGTPSAPIVARLSKMAGGFAAGVVHGGASKLSHDGYTNLFFCNPVNSLNPV